MEDTVLANICQLLSYPARRKPLVALLDSLNLLRGGFYNSQLPASERDSAIDLADEGGSIVSDAKTLLETLPPEADTDTEERDLDLRYSIDDQLSSDSTERSMLEVTALHLAASMGLARVAAIVLGEVPNIDAVDESGKSGLAVAIERGFGKAVELLMNSGASVDLNTEHGQSVFLFICENHWEGAAATIAQRSASGCSEKQNHEDQSSQYARLLLAAFHGHMELLDELISSELNTASSNTNPLNNNALFLAIERGASGRCQKASTRRHSHRYGGCEGLYCSAQSCAA